MTFKLQNSNVWNMFRVVLLMTLSCQSMLFSQQIPRGVAYSGSEFQEHIRLSFSENCQNNGPSKWSILLQKKTSEKFIMMVVACNSSSRVKIYYRSYKLTNDENIVLDDFDTSKDSAVRTTRWKAIDIHDNKNLSSLIEKIRNIQIKPFWHVDGFLDADFYSIEFINPPVSTVVKLNGIDSKKVPLAELVDNVIDEVGRN